MNIVEVVNLTKVFENLVAVDHISFSLKKGEILGLLGPNGAGKTTTLQMLLGVLEPTAGEIFFFEKNLTAEREYILNRINFSSTYMNLPWVLTVRENLRVLSYLYAIENRKKRIDEIVELFGLNELLPQSIDTLSAGQMTRLNLAKAFLNSPEVLLLDEPTASLDPDVAHYVRSFITEQRKKLDISIIMTSHNMAEVEEVCDRVIFINRGKIIADDTPQNLAKTIQISHIQLLVSKNIRKLRRFCKEKKLQMRSDGRFIIIDINEKQIARLLSDITALGIQYDEISIDQPSLEDYFISTVNRITR
ncbi:MAG: ABC transporter ATP-binding protein [Bacteroidota bacterium]